MIMSLWNTVHVTLVLSSIGMGCFGQLDHFLWVDILLAAMAPVDSRKEGRKEVLLVVESSCTVYLACQGLCGSMFANLVM